MRDGYGNVVARLVRFALLVVPVIAIAAAVVLFLAARTPGGFLPEEDQGAYFTAVQLPDGASINRTQGIVDRVAGMIKAEDGVAHVISIVGYSILDGAAEPNAAFVVARLAGYFGARRMFWGSDLSGLRCSYREAVTMFTDALTCFSADELTWVMGRSISDWLDWRPAA